MPAKRPWLVKAEHTDEGSTHNPRNRDPTLGCVVWGAPLQQARDARQVNSNNNPSLGAQKEGVSYEK